MRFSIVVLAAAVASASADLLLPRQIPNCATSCIANANLGGCSATDNACLCKNQAFVDSVTSCIVGACKGADLTNAINASKALCAAAGVTLTGTVPVATSSGSSGGTASSGSSTKTATSPASSGTSGGSSSSTTSSAPSTKTSNAALSNGVNAVAGMAALGLAFAL